MPPKNTSTYTAPSKNSSTASISDVSGQNFLIIGEGFFLLIDTLNKFLLEPLSMDWSYQSKN